MFWGRYCRHRVWITNSFTWSKALQTMDCFTESWERPTTNKFAMGRRKYSWHERAPRKARKNIIIQGCNWLHMIKQQPLSSGWEHIAIPHFLTEVCTVSAIYSKSISAIIKLDQMAHIWKSQLLGQGLRKENYSESEDSLGI